MVAVIELFDGKLTLDDIMYKDKFIIDSLIESKVKLEKEREEKRKEEMERMNKES